MLNSSTQYDLFMKKWSWLLPLTYVFHMVEEHNFGFPTWIAYLVRNDIVPASRFLNLDLLFLAGMIIGIGIAIIFPAWRWLGITLAVAIIINPLLHLIGSAKTLAYSPGMVTGSLIWLPLGGYVLFQAYKHRETSRFALGVITGIIASVIINGAFLIAARWPTG